MKKLTSIVLVLVLMVAAAVPAFAAVPETVAPLYINTSMAGIGLAFSDDGVASVAIRCTGKSSATGIDAEVYLERKVGSAWIRVTLDNGANSWTESVTTRYLIKSYTQAVNIRGEYRATVVYTIHGTTQDETLTFLGTQTF